MRIIILMLSHVWIILTVNLRPRVAALFAVMARVTVQTSANPDLG